MPNVISTTANGTAVYPISDALLSKRKLFLTEQVDAESMNTLLQELMYLEQTEPGKEITLFINSPGGECLSGLAVADYIKMLKSPVRTVCTGTAASMGAILFLCGKKREMLAHTKVMIHDPSISGLMRTNALELQVVSEDLLETRKALAEILAKHTGRTVECILEKTMTDCFFDAKAAVEFGLADSIIS